MSWLRHACVLAVVLGLSTMLRGAETGDFDGDGLITLRDIIMVQESFVENQDRFAPGSLDAFEDYPCFIDHSINSLLGTAEMISGAGFLESLRRRVPGSLPTWSFDHWPDTWLDEHPEQPLTLDSRMTVRIQDVATDGSDDVNIELAVELEEEVAGFILIIEGAEGVLRIPWLAPDHPFLSHYGPLWFGKLFGLNRIPHEDGSISVRAPVMGYLITGGKYVITRGLGGYGLENNVPPGEHIIIVKARISKDAVPQGYPLRLSDSSQVLFADGTLRRPTVESNGSLTIPGEIQAGWPDSVPPLVIDAKNQQVVGRIEFRFTDDNGVPAEPDEPLLSVKPGDSFTIRVQARTETPLNMLHFEFGWPLDALSCSDHDAHGLLEIEGESHVPGHRAGEACNSAHIGPTRFGAWFYLGANWSPLGKEYTALYDRPMAYFQPLREWIDLYRITFKVPATTPHQVVPLSFYEWNPHNPYDDRFRDPAAEFAPYRSWFYCLETETVTWPKEGLWRYDINYEDTSIIIGGGETEPPLDLGIRFVLGEVFGRAGETVDVPILASANTDLYLLSLAFSVDPDRGEVQAMKSQLAGRDRYFWHTFEPDLHLQRELDCLPPEVCPGLPGECCVLPTPAYTHFRQGENGWVVNWNNQNPSAFHGPYPGSELFEVGRIVVRLAPDLNVGDEVLVGPAVVRIDNYGIPTDLRSGGARDIFERDYPFTPADEVRQGRIVIVAGGSFLRGDTNSDNRIDLSDAVFILNYLFAGTMSPACLQAADVDDDDTIVITDAIYLLGILFLGEGVIPPPYPECGRSLGTAALSCDGPTGC